MSKIYPFKFLDSYDKDDSKLFFGRDEEISALYKMVFQSNIIVLYGASGTGKTSLIQCGLAGKFQPHDWLSLFIRRGNDINAAFAKVIADAGGNTEHKEDTIDLSELSTDDTTTIAKKLSPITKSFKAVYLNSFRPIYLIFDQFEELFILGTKDEQAKFFETVQELLKVDQPIKMIFSVREEYLGYMDDFEKAVPQLMQKKLRVEPMNLEKVREVILGVTSIPGSCISLKPGEEKQIAESIFSKIKGKNKSSSIQLPYLQVFMDKLYMETTHDETRQADAVFSMDTVNRMGDIDDVLGTFLEEQVVTISTKLTTGSTKVSHDDIWKILSQLVTLEGTKEPIKKQSLYNRLREMESKEISNTIDAFVACRLMRRSEAGDIYELAHDTLAKKITEHRPENETGLLEVKKLISDQVNNNRKGKQELFSQNQLNRIDPYIERLDLSADEQGLVNDSTKEIQRQKEATKKRTRATYAIMTVVIIALSTLAIWAITESKQAKKETAEAQVLGLRSQAFTEMYKNQDFTKGFRYAQYAYLHDTNDIDAQAALFASVFQPRFSSEHYYYQSTIKLKHTLFCGSLSPNGSAYITVGENNQVAVIRRKGGEVELVSLTGHSRDINSAIFSNDNLKVITASDDMQAIIWDAKTGHNIHVLKGHTRMLTYAAFSANGQKVITTSADSTARIWDANTGKLLQTLHHLLKVNYAAFSPDNTMVATASNDSTAVIWDVNTGRSLHTLKRHNGAVLSVAFSPDRLKIVTASDDGTARTWKIDNGDTLQTFTGHKGDVNYAAFSPDSTKVVTASSDNTVKIWDDETGKELATLAGHTAEVKFAYFIGDSVVTEARDNTMKIWETETDKVLGTLPAIEVHTGGVNAAIFSPDDKNVLTVTDNDTVKIWNIDTDSEDNIPFKSLVAHKGAINCIAYSTGNKKLLTASADNTAIIWDVATNKPIHILDDAKNGHKQNVIAASFSPDGKLVVTGSYDSTVKVWDAEKGTLIRTLNWHKSRLKAVSFSPDGKKILTAGKDSAPIIWDTKTGDTLHVLRRHTKYINSAVFSPDGKKILTASNDKTAIIWDAKTGDTLHVLKGHTNYVNSAGFSRDGKLIVTASTGKTGIIWNAETGKLLHALKGHSSALLTAVFSPDGKRIVTASLDHTAKLWDVHSGKELATLAGHEGSVVSAVFSHDGKYVLTASKDGTAKIWLVSIPDIIHDMNQKIEDMGNKEKATYGIDTTITKTIEQ